MVVDGGGFGDGDDDDEEEALPELLRYTSTGSSTLRKVSLPLVASSRSTPRSRLVKSP